MDLEASEHIHDEHQAAGDLLHLGVDHQRRLGQLVDAPLDDGGIEAAAQDRIRPTGPVGNTHHGSATHGRLLDCRSLVVPSLTQPALVITHDPRRRYRQLASA